MKQGCSIDTAGTRVLLAWTLRARTSPIGWNRMGPERKTWLLPAEVASVPVARRRVIELLRRHDCDQDRIDEVALMTTELATNAVEHACTPYMLVVDFTGRTLRVDVSDGNTDPPVVGPLPSEVALSGRGLGIVATLARRWGCRELGIGKSVWFETEALRG